MLFLDFHGWIISKSLVFKKKDWVFQVISGPQGLPLLLLYKDTSLDKLKKTGVIDINLAFQQILEDFSLLLPLRAMPSFLC